MKKYKVSHLILFTGAYGLFSLFMFFLTYEGLSIWMAINVGFAMTPLVVITFLSKRFKDMHFRVDCILIMGLLFFVFFYPNSFYIITDFMHLDKHDFYTSQQYVGTTYRLLIDPYFMLVHITISALVGIYAGIQSLLVLEDMILLKYRKKWYSRTFVVILMLLSSLGIYIGRFLRFFSWDVLNPIKVIIELFDSLSVFTIEFVVFFTFTQLLLYYGFKLIIIKSPINSD